MAVDFKTMADYVPVMVALAGVANTLVKYLLKKRNAEEENNSDLDLLTVQLDEIVALLKEIAKDGKRQVELQAYLERCKEEREGIK